ncbi:peptidase [Mycolicibacterium sp. GF69]|uniref:peptidase n=1 Tax=Mycolicibacterium sp. GF69 TaxID=2267251 RepID=UPI000DCAF377|nr:peptidase [Mycolicibacterium sp. GF69]RAV06239.1 peptidase [Mycolicibacterium sp. GF69]
MPARLIPAVLALFLLVACTPTKVDGRATSMLFNPERAGGLPVTEGPSGPNPGAPQPVGTVENTDGGSADRLALLALNDIEDFWHAHYAKYLPGDFKPVDTLVSYDSEDPDSPTVCLSDTYGLVNAMYCIPRDLIAWDRGVLVPVAIKYFGEMGVVGVLAHEYGHALQYMSGLADKDTDVLVKEQQADCLAGVYMHSVAAGDSRRFALSTGDGLNRVLAGLIYLRDPVSSDSSGDAHGSALDRVSAFQLGFTGGADQCAAIDLAEIEKRRGDLPQQLTYDSYGEPVLDSPIDEDTLNQLMGVLAEIFQPADEPALTTDPPDCGSAQTTTPTSYCPATNVIHADLPALREVGEPKSEEEDEVLIQGDNTALSMVTSRYALAVQQERGVKLDTPVAALRTACLTGVAQGHMTEDAGFDFVLSPGDADEAVSGLLTNPLVASDVNGQPARSGFTRILAYRLGLSSDVDECFQRFA